MILGGASCGDGPCHVRADDAQKDAGLHVWVRGTDETHELCACVWCRPEMCAVASGGLSCVCVECALEAGARPRPRAGLACAQCAVRAWRAAAGAADELLAMVACGIVRKIHFYEAFLVVHCACAYT